ncbi:MAG: four helix bundle protein [Lewinellaceae bacterium]|nr:four helix bundle protein [Saprospiraceae bacterium]MCB9344140.1 four helix bundle protein [Lewinellaceae bacterium]
MKPSKPNPLRDKSLLLGVRIVRLSQYLIEQKHEIVISKQILKSGTNPGAMIREAQHAESSADFIHKLAVAQKEINETAYWLELLMLSDYINQEQFDSLNKDTIEIMKLLVSSIRTKKQNHHKTTH